MCGDCTRPPLTHVCGLLRAPHLQVYIRGASIDPAAFGSGGGAMRAYGGGHSTGHGGAPGLALAPTTFALVDLLSFESQSTPLATGTAPVGRAADAGVACELPARLRLFFHLHSRGADASHVCAPSECRAHRLLVFCAPLQPSHPTPLPPLIPTPT
jgi:hypothetical protein